MHFGGYTYRCGGIWGGPASEDCARAGLEGVLRDLHREPSGVRLFRFSQLPTPAFARSKKFRPPRNEMVIERGGCACYSSLPFVAAARTAESRLRMLGNGKTPVATSDEQLLSVLALLEECRAVLQSGGSRDTAQLISVAILDLRMKLNRISDAELKALCEAMLPDEAPD